MKKFIKDLFKKVCAKIYEVKTFWAFFFVMLFISLIDLIGLGKDGDFGAGFVVTFLYFVTWIIYQSTKKKE